MLSVFSCSLSTNNIQYWPEVYLKYFMNKKISRSGALFQWQLYCQFIRIISLESYFFIIFYQYCKVGFIFVSGDLNVRKYLQFYKSIWASVYNEGLRSWRTYIGTSERRLECLLRAICIATGIWLHIRPSGLVWRRSLDNATKLYMTKFNSTSFDITIININK